MGPLAWAAASAGTSAASSLLGPGLNKAGNEIFGIPTPGEEQRQYLETLFPNFTDYELAGLSGAAGGAGESPRVAARQAARQSAAQNTAHLSGIGRQAEASEYGARANLAATAIGSGLLKPEGVEALLEQHGLSGVMRPLAFPEVDGDKREQLNLDNIRVYLDGLRVQDQLRGGTIGPNRFWRQVMHDFGIDEFHPDAGMDAPDIWRGLENIGKGGALVGGAGLVLRLAASIRAAATGGGVKRGITRARKWLNDRGERKQLMRWWKTKGKKSMDAELKRAREDKRFGRPPNSSRIPDGAKRIVGNDGKLKHLNPPGL